MLKNLSIGLRILLGSALVLILSIGAILPLVLVQFSAMTDRAEQRQLEDLYYALSQSIDAQAERAQALSAAIAGMPAIQEAFALRDRDALTRLTLPIFESMRDRYAVSQFQFLTAPATSFLRLHLLERHGDDLRSMRQTIVEANATGQPIKGLEKGVAGLGLRGVAPVFYQGAQVGVVEFGLSFGQPFFDAFKAGFRADAALQVVAKDGGFETFAGTLTGGTRLTPDALKAVMGGATLTRHLDYAGVPSAVYGRVINDFSGQPVGVVELLIDRQAAVAAYQRATLSILGLGLFLLAIGMGLSWLIARGISRPIACTAASLGAIAADDGDLTQRLEAEGRNELADLARAFNRFVDKIHVLVKQVASAATQLSAAAEQLSVTSSETSQQVRAQQTETDQVAAAINQMTATVEEVARHAAEAARLTQETRREAGSGEEVVQQTIAMIEALARDVEQAGQVVQRLSEDSKEIGAVLEVIRGVAEQTNLLALNAAIEAARAGEQGRGFAVVADEVRTLASRTQASTEDIRQKIERVQGSSAGAVAEIARSQVKARDGVDQARRAGESFQAISCSVVSVNDMNTQIASAAEEQSAVSEEINRNIQNISHAVEQTAAGSGNIAQASDELARLAAELQQRVGSFRI